MRGVYWLVLGCLFLIGEAIGQPLNIDAVLDNAKRVGTKPPSITVDKDVHDLNDAGKRNTERKKEEAAQEMRRIMSSGGESPSSPSKEQSEKPNNGAWKVLRSYTGGFVDFGFAGNHTIYVVRCGNGREYKIYQNGSGRWGSIQSLSNPSAPSLEAAAAALCR